MPVKVTINLLQMWRIIETEVSIFVLPVNVSVSVPNTHHRLFESAAISNVVDIADVFLYC